MKNRNLLATFELSQGDEKTMETIAEAITHADHCFVKIGYYEDKYLALLPDEVRNPPPQAKDLNHG